VEKGFHHKPDIYGPIKEPGQLIKHHWDKKNPKEYMAKINNLLIQG